MVLHFSFINFSSFMWEGSVSVEGRTREYFLGGKVHFHPSTKEPSPSFQRFRSDLRGYTFQISTIDPSTRNDFPPLTREPKKKKS